MKKIFICFLTAVLLCGCAKVHTPETVTVIPPQIEKIETKQEKEPIATKPEINEQITENESTEIQAEIVSETDNDKPLCTISISCKAIAENIDKLPEEKHFLVPADGIILSETEVEISEGETAFDVLNKITREKGIHMEFVETTLYNSVYIEGINNLYEFDCGENSGWIYTVNGKTLSKSSSKYLIKDGDRIAWLYTVDLGRDIQND